MGEAESTALRQSPPSRSGFCPERAGSWLAVEPNAARARVARPLAPDGDGLAGRGDGDLAVVAVDLEEASGGLVGRAAGCIGEAHRGRPAGAAVRRAAVVHV